MLFVLYEIAHPGVINYRAGGGECRLRLPGMKSDRHPDQADLPHTPNPKGRAVWTRWVPADRGRGRERERRGPRLRREARGISPRRRPGILDPRPEASGGCWCCSGSGDIWEERLLGEDGVHRTELLPGLEARVGELLGPPEPEPAEDEGE